MSQICICFLASNPPKVAGCWPRKKPPTTDHITIFDWPVYKIHRKGPGSRAAKLSLLSMTISAERGTQRQRSKIFVGVGTRAEIGVGVGPQPLATENDRVSPGLSGSLGSGFYRIESSSFAFSFRKTEVILFIFFSSFCCPGGGKRSLTEIRALLC